MSEQNLTRLLLWSRCDSQGGGLPVDGPSVSGPCRSPAAELHSLRVPTHLQRRPAVEKCLEVTSTAYYEQEAAELGWSRAAKAREGPG